MKDKYPLHIPTLVISSGSFKYAVIEQVINFNQIPELSGNFHKIIVFCSSVKSNKDVIKFSDVIYDVIDFRASLVDTIKNQISQIEQLK